MWQLLGLAEVNALGYKSDVHKHLRRLERAFGSIFRSITSPHASMTGRMFLLKAKQPEFSKRSGGQLIDVMAGLLGDMSSCQIMFISFAEPK